MGFNSSGFDDLARQLEELGEEFDEKVERRGGGPGRDPESGKFATVEDAIIGAINETMDETVVPQADTNARKYLPSDTDPKIDHQSRGWRGDTYQHDYFSTEELVKYHEFGTGTHGPVGSEYIITPNKQDALSFFWEKIGEQVVFESVTHPGVEGKHFMERALRRNTRTFERNLADWFDDMEF